MGDRLDRLEARVIRAFEVDRALPDHERDWLKVRAYGLLTRPGPGDYPPEQVTRFRPKPAEVSDYLVVMRVVATLHEEEARAGVSEEKRSVRLLRLRSYGMSYRSIADRVGGHEQTVKKRFERAIARLGELADVVGAAADRPGA